MTRRHLFRLAAALPAAGLFDRFHAIAGPQLRRVKITDVRAMAIRNRCLSFAGLFGIGYGRTFPPGSVRARCSFDAGRQCGCKLPILHSGERVAISRRGWINGLIECAE